VNGSRSWHETRLGAAPALAGRLRRVDWSPLAPSTTSSAASLNWLGSAVRCRRWAFRMVGPRGIHCPPRSGATDAQNGVFLPRILTARCLLPGLTQKPEAAGSDLAALSIGGCRRRRRLGVPGKQDVSGDDGARRRSDWMFGWCCNVADPRRGSQGLTFVLIGTGTPGIQIPSVGDDHRAKKSRTRCSSTRCGAEIQCAGPDT